MFQLLQHVWVLLQFHVVRLFDGWFGGEIVSDFERDLRKFVTREPQKWEMPLPYLLFSIGEDPQSSMGLLPFELLYGRQPQGMLDLLNKTRPGKCRGLLKSFWTCLQPAQGATLINAQLS